MAVHFPLGHPQPFARIQRQPRRRGNNEVAREKIVRYRTIVYQRYDWKPRFFVVFVDFGLMTLVIQALCQSS